MEERDPGRMGSITTTPDTMTISSAPSQLSQPASIPCEDLSGAGPANFAGFTGPWFEAGTGNMASAGNFQLPSGQDTLQAYFPLMLNNFNVPFQDPLGQMNGAGHSSDFSSANTPEYLSNQTPTPNVANNMASHTGYRSMNQNSQWPMR